MSNSIASRLAALPVDVTAALDAYASANGRTWRAKLRALWEAGQDEGALRQARNLVGPSDLASYKPAPVASTPEPAPVVADLDASRPWFVECRTLRGDVVRRHGPFGHGSEDLANAYHSEMSAAHGHNRSRRHDDESCQRIFRFAAPAPAPVSMVSQPVQQQQANAGAISDDAFRAAAYAAHGREGEIECDDTATVSRGDEPGGAFVAMWVWISDDEARAHMAPVMVPQIAQQQQARDRRAAFDGVVRGGAPEILQDGPRRDVAEILAAMEAELGPVTSWRSPRPVYPASRVLDVSPSPIGVGAGAVMIAGVAGITAAAVAFALALFC